MDDGVPIEAVGYIPHCCVTLKFCISWCHYQIRAYAHLAGCVSLALYGFGWLNRFGNTIELKLIERGAYRIKRDEYSIG